MTVFSELIIKIIYQERITFEVGSNA